MIVYSATRAEFTRDVFSNQIEEVVLASFKRELGRTTGPREIASWKNSLQYMNNVLVAGDIPEDAGVAIEYQVPPTSKRVDFIITGADENHQDVALIVELKQWESAGLTDKDGVVSTLVGNGIREVTHPSYQAWTYAALIRDFNMAVQEGDIDVRACAYLHNCITPEVIHSDFYKLHTDRAPSFLKRETEALQQFLSRFVKYGDKSKILYRIENGRLRPSRDLADHMVSLITGNAAFQMIDDQKIVYETALALTGVSSSSNKQVLLVEGGPGTGKSVVAVNLLVEMTHRNKVVHYVSRNAAPRKVYESKLAGTITKSRISNMFKGSGSYVDVPKGQFDTLIVDEAHRLNLKSGLYQNIGENQVKEIIAAADLSVFFLDEDQRVTIKDIGTRDEILKWATDLGASVTEQKLESQFRCNGSDGYLAWVDSALQIRQTANPTLEGIDYEFEVFASPNQLRDEIYRRNVVENKARLVAGYCWPWKGKKDPAIRDIVIPEHDFAMRWNLGSDGSLWIVAPESVSEVGCIHTCQGLELEYVGVIIGPDLVVRDGSVITDAAKRAPQDSSVRGYKTMLKRDPEQAARIGDRVVKNTYRTLMTRGQKGCFVFSTDRETNDYFSSFQGSHTSEYPKVADGD